MYLREGTESYNNKKYLDAIKLFEKALSVFNAIPKAFISRDEVPHIDIYQRNLAVTHHQVALLSFKFGNIQKAVEYHRNALHEFSKTPFERRDETDERSLLIYQRNLIYLLGEMGDYDFNKNNFNLQNTKTDFKKIIEDALQQKVLFVSVKQMNRLKALLEPKTVPQAALPAIPRDKFKQTELLKRAVQLGLPTECKQLIGDKAEPSLELAKEMETKGHLSIAADMRSAYYKKLIPPYQRTRAHQAVLDQKVSEISATKTFGGKDLLLQPDTLGWTPTLLAVINNDEKMVDKLRQEGVDIKAELSRLLPPHQNTLAHVAATSGNIHTFKLIHKLAGAQQFSQTNALGHTPMFEAARLGKFGVLLELIKLKADINHPRDCLPALGLVYGAPDSAWINPQVGECVTALVKAQCNFTLADTKGVSPINEAIKEKRWQLLLHMLIHVPVLHAFSSKDLFALHTNKFRMINALKETLSDFSLNQAKRQALFNAALNPATCFGSILVSAPVAGDDKLFRPNECLKTDLIHFGLSLNLAVILPKPALASGPLFVKRNPVQ